MCAPGWLITSVLIRLFGSATSSPLIIHTPTPLALPSQIPPPSLSPTNNPSLLSPFLNIPSSVPPSISSPGELTENAECNLKISPPTVVVRFGDPVKANCSKGKIGFPMLAWKVPLEEDEATFEEDHLIWSVDSLTQWDIKPTCYAVAEVGGKCDIDLSLIVYQPPQMVSIRFVNHTGPMFEGHLYNLQCTVEDVAPIERVIVTFYRGQTTLAQLQSNITAKTPTSESFNLSIIPCKQHNRSQYWCEVKLELGPEGPQHPPVVKSQHLTALVLSSPQVTRPTEQQAKANIDCEMERTPEPLGASGTTNSCQGYFLLAALLLQMIN